MRPYPPVVPLPILSIAYSIILANDGVSCPRFCFERCLTEASLSFLHPVLRCEVGYALRRVSWGKIFIGFQLRRLSKVSITHA